VRIHTCAAANIRHLFVWIVKVTITMSLLILCCICRTIWSIFEVQLRSDQQKIWWNSCQLYVLSLHTAICWIL